MQRRDSEKPAASRESFAEDVSETAAVCGRNAVLELLKSGRSVDKLFVRKGDREGSITLIVAEALNRGIPVIEVDKAKIDSLAPGMQHQGVVAMAASKEYVTVDEILAIAKEKGEKPLIVIADEIADPHNLGAIIRCAEGAGAHGLIIPKRRSTGLTPVVEKASAGALAHLAIAKVPNISTAIDELKEKGVWIYGAEAGGSAYYDTKFDSATAIVVGSEGGGISRLVREKCDFMISIPMFGEVNSFNVSCAAAVILCEAARQLKTQ
ncbi:MAG: 23S rRNA (guanosine(2251)-2'-O)-methyltransferase RlmB [Clostridia bacterium]|nr:23S rRNA (guanosine(2251)-2'-O)-methyltransferase RlmB [Clostridia bacterium]